eukprot:4697276-Heterocapsa_arctica.AAC.2
MLGAVGELSQDFLDAGDMDNATLLQRGKELLVARYGCFGSLMYPPSCTSQAAWRALRAAMCAEAYWFSVEELQVLTAA